MCRIKKSIHFSARHFSGISPMVRIALPKNGKFLHLGFSPAIKESVTDDLFQAQLPGGGDCAASQEVMCRSRITMPEQSMKAP